MGLFWIHLATIRVRLARPGNHLYVQAATRHQILTNSKGKHAYLLARQASSTTKQTFLVTLVHRLAFHASAPLIHALLVALINSSTFTTTPAELTALLVGSPTQPKTCVIPVKTIARRANSQRLLVLLATKKTLFWTSISIKQAVFKAVQWMWVFQVLIISARIAIQIAPPVKELPHLVPRV